MVSASFATAATAHRMPKFKKIDPGYRLCRYPGYYNFYATLTSAVLSTVLAASRVVAWPSGGVPSVLCRGAIATIAAVVTMRKYRSQPPRMSKKPRLSNVPIRWVEPAGPLTAPYGSRSIARIIRLS